MAKLTVRFQGEEIIQLDLELGQEYVAGRAPESQIPLSAQRGISRQHLKFYERDGVWICECLSKFVLLQRGGQSFEILELTEAQNFMLPPFEFHFEPTVTSEDSADPQPSPHNVEPQYQPRVLATTAPVSENTTGPRANNEATVAGLATLVPYIRISYPNTADDEVLKLEGHIWIAGRDHDCEIHVDSAHISRKHFELARTKEGFFITDLGSSNGTKLNGHRLPPHEPTRVDSGDEIRVMNIIMNFEIRDTQFANRVENLPVPVFNPMLANPPAHWYPSGPMNDEKTFLPVRRQDNIPSLREWKKLRPHHLKQVDWKKNKVRVAILILAPVLLISSLMPENKTPQRDPNSSDQSLSFDKLTQEKKSVVKDSFALARNLYVQGKYTLCLTELAKVHELIPQFENSKELQSFCEQGLELVRRQEDLDRKDREKAMIEQQITGYVDGCKAKLTTLSTVDETRQCLAEAIVLSPEHPLVIEMIHSAQMNEEERKFQAKTAAEIDAKARKGEAHFQKALALYKKGKLSASIEEFERYLNREYPRSADSKAKARRQVASIKKELSTKVAAWMQECKALGGKGQFKVAYLECDKAVNEDPSNHEAKEYRDKMLLELRREMKAIYEDSVLEESLGNVDSAKEKWKKIVDENLSFDDYTTKAKSKLQKYGLGL